MLTGFDYAELTAFQRKLMREINELLPKDMAEFITDEAKAYLKEVRKEANATVKKGKAHYRIRKKDNKKISTNYHKSFKVGKKYKRDKSLCIRVYNKARHAHLIENGHSHYSHGKYKGYVFAKNVLANAQSDYNPTFTDHALLFLADHFKNIVEK